ncbi:MAG TPA: DUF4118 domain-containing protein [Moraxellaceae bacterium]|nr:DUF4118 domain-containing protein [Moraxellaceae bacterium]
MAVLSYRHAGPGAYLVVVLACAVVTFLAAVLPWLAPANSVALFLLVVLSTAIRYGRGPAVLAAFLGVGMFDFFLVPPHLSFAVADVQYLLVFAVMLAVALTTGHLAARLRLEAEQASQKEQHTRLLYELARELAGTLVVAQVAQAVHAFLQGIGLDALLLVPDREDALQPTAVPDAPPPRIDTRLARLAYDRAEQIELDHLAAFGEAAVYFPLKAPMRCRGVLAVSVREDHLPALHNAQPLLRTASSLIAIALERIHYAEIAQETQVQMLSERLRSSILSALSHDVRTPLTALVGLADSLSLLQPPLSAQAKETADAIAEQARLLHGLVENLLDMARLNVGEVRLHKDWCVIEDVIASSLQLLRVAVATHPVRIKLAPDLQLVEFDAVLVERVLANLLENAAKYSPPDAPIDIDARNQDGELVVSVCDRGRGLPAGRRDELFSLFVRGEVESATPGMGLGLAICKAIVDAHGGRIHAEDREGGGACFRFTLPLGIVPALDDEALVLARERGV